MSVSGQEATFARATDSRLDVSILSDSIAHVVQGSGALCLQCQPGSRRSLSCEHDPSSALNPCGQQVWFWILTVPSQILAGPAWARLSLQCIVAIISHHSAHGYPHDSCKALRASTADESMTLAHPAAATALRALRLSPQELTGIGSQQLDTQEYHAEQGAKGLKVSSGHDANIYQQYPLRDASLDSQCWVILKRKGEKDICAGLPAALGRSSCYLRHSRGSFSEGQEGHRLFPGGMSIQNACPKRKSRAQLNFRRAQVEMSGETPGTDSSSESVPLRQVIICHVRSCPVLR